MANFDDDEDFFEDDEPLEKVVAAFESGTQGVTVNPLVQYVQTPDEYELLVPLVVATIENQPSVGSATTSDEEGSLAGLINA